MIQKIFTDNFRGAFSSHRREGFFGVSATAMNKILSVLKGIWAFCSYLFWPQWGRKEGVG